MKIKKFIGDKKFYITVLTVALPIMLQNGITNLVNFLDNFMVGMVGTEEMSAVGIVNELVFVFNLVIFGAVSGAGIFTAQFYGHKDLDGVRYTFRFKFIICSILTLLIVLLFYTAEDFLISLFLNEGSVEGDLELTLLYGKDYLKIAVIGLIPYAICQVYSDTLRQTGETMLPMLASLFAVVLNFCLNYLLIFGKLGFPEMGVEGAALATTISRFLEMATVVLYSHCKSKKYTFLQGVYKSFKIPLSVIKRIVIKGLPLFFNESLWSIGMAFLSKLYSERGLSVFAGFNIATTVQNLFSIVFISLGNSVGIIVGNFLGANDFETAKDYDNKLIAFSVAMSVVMGLIMFIVSPFIPKLYTEVGNEAKEIATYIIAVMAFFLPFHAFLQSCYFTLRSGGRTVMTFIFDSVFVWIIFVPVCSVLIYCTDLSIYYVYPMVLSCDFLKCVLGYIFVKKNIWLKNITEVKE